MDPFNYETMKTALLERLDSFSAAPFTVQRICELLTDPRKQYSRIDKFMRAIEKNILVVSTTEPGRPKSLADSSDYSDSLDSMVNGSSNVTGGALGDDLAGDIDVDIELENGTAAIAVVEGGPPITAALPSINTLNSTLLAANQTPATTTADDLLSQHHPLTDEDVEDEDDDDDEDVVHNHLTTDPAEGAVLSDAAAPVPVATEAVDENTKLAAKKPRAEEGDEEESAKRAKLGDKEEEKKSQETIPEKQEDKEVATTTPAEEASSETATPTPQPTEAVAKEEETCEKEAKDSAVEAAKAEEKAAEPAVALITPSSEESDVVVEAKTEVAAESEKKGRRANGLTWKTVTVPCTHSSFIALSLSVEETPTEPASSVVPPAEPVLAEVAKESLSPAEAMDDKPIESVDAMEAETVASEAAPIAASEMDIDSSEGTATVGPAIVSEESVSMDEPMEDQ